ncbi:MAG: DNA repair protein RecN [Deltaproteobacteria bacterium]|nr:DNA repair protein RecN [Deltaproteobacteria bacterium]MBI3388639.1 DNA repair protein RecN [Deltaproteobacteria bacterium]
MLRSLRIANFAIIDELALEFAPGLNVLTGETGAGKSIIMQALGLLCGARGSADLIRTGADEAAIDAVLDLSADARTAATELGLDGDDELSLRRMIARAGKGRLHLNGSPSTLAVLTQLGLRLLHIYGQHEYALLLHPDTHLDLLDDLGRLTAPRHEFTTAYRALVAAHHNLTALTQGGQAARAHAELLRFQITELEAAAPEPDEESHLQQEREVLRHAEQLAQACDGGEAALYSGDDAAAPVVARIRTQLRDLARIDPRLSEIAALLDAAHTQLDEAALQLRQYANRIHHDPDRLAAADERLALLRQLARKHNCRGDELAAQLETLRAELDRVTGAGLDLESAQQAVTVAARAAWRSAAALSAVRRLAGCELERRMHAELPTLGMEGATFTVQFASEMNASEPSASDPFVLGEARLSERGGDRVEFHLSANRGEAPRPLAKVASGGELSRIMLALKVLTAGAGEVDTLIFDEVDTGIGGTVADAVGRRLKALACERQILCITHLPQIAVHADHHFAVEKRVRKGRTVTSAKALSPDERVVELSRMLGGAVTSREAERYARRLISEAHKGSPA